MRGRVDHIILTVCEPAASFALYDAFLRFLGYELASRGEAGIEWVLASDASHSVGLVKAQGSGIERRHDRYSPGLHHLAWSADSREDVDRLRYILKMQRDHYLPLRVIGEHLDAIDRGLEPPPIEGVVPTVPRVALAADGLPSPESFSRSDNVRLSRKELVKIAEVSEALLDQLEQYGLIVPRAGTGHYDTDALVIAEVKTRRTLDYGHPFEAVGPDKLARLHRLGAAWCRDRELRMPLRRIDVIAVIDDGGGSPLVEHLRGVG